jgi:hypothetical protein
MQRFERSSRYFSPFCFSPVISSILPSLSASFRSDIPSAGVNLGLLVGSPIHSM